MKNEIRKFMFHKTSNICRHCCWFKNGSEFLLEMAFDEVVEEDISEDQKENSSINK